MRRFSEKQKDAAALSQERAEYAALAANPLGFGMAFVPVAGPFLAGAAIAVGFALGARAIKQGRIVRDPPDPNFREPVRVPEPQLDLSRLGDEPFQTRAAEFAQVNEKAGSICGAMVGSLERAMGAEMEGEDEHAAARLREAGQLAGQLAQSLELSLELNGPLREALLELEWVEPPPAQEERVRLGDVLPADALAELERVGIPRDYLFGDTGLIEVGGQGSDPIEAFADGLSALEEGDRVFSETLRRQLQEGSLFVEEEEEMPGGGAPLPAG
jgi:hypothetical protein